MLRDTLVRLEALTVLPHVSDEYVRFRMALLRAQWAVRRALTATPQRARPALPTEPLLDRQAVPFDDALLESLFTALRAAAAKVGRQGEDLRRIAQAVAADPAWLDRLVRASAFGPDLEYLESIGRQAGVVVDALLFVGRALAAPFVAEAVRRIASARMDLAGAGGDDPHCSMCGSPASIGRLRRDDGRRLLTCGLCGWDWEFARLACACCGTRAGEALGTLRVAADDPRWVETCEACKGYLKLVDMRRLPADEAVLPVVEETATLHLDLLAEREGYTRRVPYVLSG